MSELKKKIDFSKPCSPGYVCVANGNCEDGKIDIEKFPEFNKKADDDKDCSAFYEECCKIKSASDPVSIPEVIAQPTITTPFVPNFESPTGCGIRNKNGIWKKRISGLGDYDAEFGDYLQSLFI